MNNDLLAKLCKTKSVVLPRGTVRTLDDSELADVIGGLTSTLTFVNGRPNDIAD